MNETLFVMAATALSLASCGGNDASTEGIITKGEMIVNDLGNFKLHVYQSGDVMADASFIVEGKNELVLMELPLFKENAAEFEAYADALGKPVCKIISDYHLGGSAEHKLTMPEGMPDFIEGPVYSGMMRHFAEVFGDTMVEIPNAETEELPYGKPVELAGIPFELRHGAATDFPGASIIIGNKVYYTHWAPAEAHASHLQIGSPAAIDAEIAEAQNELASGCTVFVGGHGGQTTREAIAFKIAYLETMKRILSENATAETFVTAMQRAYPQLSGAEGLPELGKALYQ